MVSSDKEAMVLLSGGIDSTACVAFYLSQGFSLSALFVDYGQLSSHSESEAAAAVSEHYRIPLRRTAISGLRQRSGGYIPGRNAFLLFNALLAFRSDAGIIGIGIHSGTTYQDCSEQFVKQMQSSFDLYTDGRISIGAPFLRWNKLEVWHYSQDAGAPLHLTYSCELGRQQPCGECLSCKDTEALHAR
jgi:7-cyano-7-deazaguanine synthase